MIRTGFVHLDINGNIKNMKMPKIVATSDSADIIYIFADFDIATSETAYRCSVRMTRADRLNIGPIALTLSQVTQDEADSFGVDYLACRKLTMPKQALAVNGPVKITIIYDQLNESGTVIRTSAQPEFNVYVYDAVPEVLTEDEYTEIRNEFMPRDLGDIIISEEFKDDDQIPISQNGITKKITGETLKESISDSDTLTALIEKKVNKDEVRKLGTYKIKRDSSGHVMLVASGGRSVYVHRVSGRVKYVTEMFDDQTIKTTFVRTNGKVSKIIKEEV